MFNYFKRIVPKLNVKNFTNIILKNIPYTSVIYNIY